jgi:DNA-binding NarL/FixJ family response regulator
MLFSSKAGTGVMVPHVGASILVAESHYPLRERLRGVLSSAGFDVATAPDTTHAERIARAQGPDLCLVDLELPGGGVAAVTRLRAVAPAAVVIVLTYAYDEDALLAALDAGAGGHVWKGADVTALPGLLRRALDGEVLLHGRMAARLLEELRERGRRRRLVAARAHGVELTRREWQVLELLEKHLTTAEIAGRLFVAPVTVRTHVASILHKLQVPHREAALRLLDGREESPDGW